jgi:dipeptidyl aminopeptidase/acylaminoacyl peptidase
MRPVARDDLLDFRVPGDVQLAPDGESAVWTERFIERPSLKTRVRILRGMPGTDALALTDGSASDASPRLSPDGATLVFVRSAIPDRDRKSRLCVVAMSGGEPRVLVEWEGTFGAPSWSPDGQSLAIAFRPSDHVPEGESAPVSIRVTKLRYKEDGEGYLPTGRHRLFRVEVASGATTVLSEDGDWDDTEPQFSPDGARIAFLSNRRPERHRDFENKDLFVMPASGGEATQCTRERSLAFAPSWAPDGTWLALCSAVGPPASALFRNNVELYRVDASGREAPVSLTASLDRCVMNLTIDDLWGLAHWQHPARFAGDRLLFPVSDRGTTYLAALPLDATGRPTGPIARVIEGPVVQCFATSAARIAAITTSAAAPGRVELFDLDGRPTGLVAAPLAEYVASVDVRPPHELHARAEDGTEVQAWLLLPRGEGPFPLLLSIHGGPVVQYGACFFHEMQCLAATGFAVLLVNPRGSQGYGKTFASATHLDWATKPYVDLMAALDAAVAAHPIDTARLGVLGGSYGGYMATWCAASSRRFKAACAERTVSDMEALIWSDFGWVLGDELEAWPWENPERYRRMSPKTYVGAIQTPMLVMQGTGDQRTPTDQGERLYVMLRAMGKEAELVLFPGASHNLSRSGPARQRVERLRCLEEWFRRHLLQ